jgi:hypothetical protein
MRKHTIILMNKCKTTLQLVYGLEVVGIALVGRGPEKSRGTRVLGLAKVDAVSAWAKRRS